MRAFVVLRFYFLVIVIVILNVYFQLGQCKKFGRSLRAEFYMDDDYIQLNHGAFGTYPKVVGSALRSYQTRSERNPDLWIRRDARTELDKVRALLAAIINADKDDVVMVPNTTSGINAVLRSLLPLLAMGDRILHMSTIFSSMDKLVQYMIDSTGGNKLSRLVFNLTYPVKNEVILEEFEEFLNKNVDVNRPIKIAIIDHISSTPAVVMPIDRIIPMLHSRGIQVLIDGAHAIGQTPINITALKPDYYVTNCHKWLYAARGCALLYVDKKHQVNIHPVQITSVYKSPSDFQNEFFWTGTMDYSSYMTVPTALKFREEMGGEDEIMQHNHNLAFEGGHLAAKYLGTEVLQSEDQMGSMVDIRLPLGNDIRDDPKLNLKFWTDIQLDKYSNTFSLIHKHNGHWWGRISAQIYNDVTDFEFVARHFKNICDEVNNKQV